MVNRPPPRLPATAVTTYEISAPVATHWRPASCEEVECAMFLLGFKVVADESTDLGQRQAELIRPMARPAHHIRRRFTESKDPAGMTVFTFPAGQECFAKHRAPLLRPPLLLVRGGDWRGNPLQIATRTHTRPEFWTEDFAEHQQKLADQQQKG